MDYKATNLEVIELKAGQDGWSFSAYASTFGNRDWGGDIIATGAFDKTLKSGGFRPLLWQHDSHSPIGIETSLKTDTKGLLGSWELIDTQQGADAYKLLKRGAVRSMSIGYIPEAFEFDDQGDTRIIKEVNLLENSVATIPMNPQARVQSVKAKYCSECGVQIGASLEDLYDALLRKGKHKSKTLDLNTQVPFEELCTQIKGHLIYGMDAAEALHARRTEDQRELTQPHIDALTVLLSELKDSGGRIEAILNAVSPPEVKANGALSLHIALANAKRRDRARDRARLELGATTP